MFSWNSPARSTSRCLRTNRQMLIALSRSSIPAMASARSSRWSWVAHCCSATSIPTRSPGVRVSRLMLFSMLFSTALAKYALG
jgi:hypothetical protein